MDKKRKGVMLAVISLPIVIGAYDIFFRDLSLTNIVKTTGIGLLLNLGGTILLIFIKERTGRSGIDQEKQTEWRRFSEAVFKAKGWYKLIIFTLIAEELMFRGPLFIATILLELSTTIWILLILIDGIIFGIAHFKQDSSLEGFIARFWAGVVLGWMVISSSSLIPSICLHLLWSGSLFGIEYLTSKTSKQKNYPEDFRVFYLELQVIRPPSILNFPSKNFSITQTLALQ
jgi:membrane protease YdiL (CAAX protease family)